MGFGHQHPFGQHQIGQGKQGVELRRVFAQPSVAYLSVSEEVFHHMEGVFHPGSHLCLESLDLLA